MQRVANALRCTEGQAYTVALGLLFSVVLLVLGVPPVLRHARSPVPAAASPAAAPDAADAPAGLGVETPPAPEDPAGSDTGPFLPEPPPSADGPLSAPTSSSVERPAPEEPTSDRIGGGPLTIAEAGWTTAGAGAPLAGSEVPEGGLPVGARLGQVDKASYLRFAGTVGPLRLAVVDDPAASRLVALAVVRACVIVRPGWALGPASPPAEAPPVDGRRCVDGAQGADGVWSFSLERLSGLDPAAGVALLPVVEGPTTFQVTFSPAVPA